MPLHSAPSRRAHSRARGAHAARSVQGPRGGNAAAGEASAPLTRASGSWRRQLTRRLREWGVIVVIAAVAAFVLHTFVVATFLVPSGSMYPTLMVGDRILTDKLPYFSHDIHTGDIIVFHRVPRDNDPTQPAYLVKRVIGLPGQTISSSGSTVLINGKALQEPWLPDFAKLPPSWLCSENAENIPTTKIQPGHYFVMGDCRGNSYDSRAWGTVPLSAVVGKVFAVVWRNNHPWLHWF